MTKPISTGLVSTYFGVEDSGAPGDAVAADKQFATLNVKAVGAGTFQDYDAEGVLIPVATIEGEEWATGDLDGPADYGEGPYIFNNALVHVDRTQIGSSGGWEGLWIKSATSAQTQDPWTLERGDGRTGLNNRYTYATIIDLGLNATRKAVKRKGKLLARRGDQGVDLTGGATRMERAPIIPKTVDFYLSTDSWAALDAASIVDGGWEVDIQALAGSLSPTWPLDSSLPSFKDLIASKFKPKVKFMIAVNAASIAFFDTMRAGDLIWSRLLMTGPQIGLDGSDPVYFTERWDLALQFAKVPDEKDHDKAYSYDFELIPVPDGDHSGSWLEVYSITNIADPLP